MSKLLRAYNGQAAVECRGYATDGEMLVLLDIIGHKTACKSIWATTVGSARDDFTIAGSGQANVVVHGGEIKRTKYRAFWTELPEQQAHNLVICHSRALDAQADGNASAFYLIIDELDMRLTLEHINASHATLSEANRHRLVIESVRLPRFAALLNQALELPTLSVWGEWLWVAGIDAKLIVELHKGGSVVDAWRVMPADVAWAKLVQDGLRDGHIVLSRESRP